MKPLDNIELTLTIFFVLLPNPSFCYKKPKISIYNYSIKSFIV